MYGSAASIQPNDTQKEVWRRRQHYHIVRQLRTHSIWPNLRKLPLSHLYPTTTLRWATFTTQKTAVITRMCVFLLRDLNFLKATTPLTKTLLQCLSWLTGNRLQGDNLFVEESALSCRKRVTLSTSVGLWRSSQTINQVKILV